MLTAVPWHTPAASKTPLSQHSMSLSTTSQQAPLLESSYKQHVPSARATPSHVDGTLQKVPCISQGKVRRCVRHVMLCVGRVISSRLLKRCLWSKNGARKINIDLPNASGVIEGAKFTQDTQRKGKQYMYCMSATQNCMHACAHACSMLYARPKLLHA